MSKVKFPQLLHVTREAPEHDTPFFVPHIDGIFTVEEDQPCALYKLVKVGKVSVDRKFVERK